MDNNHKTIKAYDNNSQFYADKFDSYGIRADDIDRALKLNESGCDRVLELGCGNGRDAQYIVSKVGKDNYVGIDASEGLVMLAKEKVSPVTFQVKDMREVSYETETFGVIFSFASMLHVNREELSDIVEKCHKWLKIGGILYISTKYGEYKELEIENLNDKKYYYPYAPEDIQKIAGLGFKIIYNVIQDSDYGPELVIALKKL
jgi:SAM-dependent methyltransferase